MQEGIQEHQHRAERIEVLLQEVGTFSDPHVSEVIEELVQSLLDMYGEGLKRLLELTVQTDASSHELVKKFTNDDLIGSLLMLHGLHPVDIQTRVLQALDEVRPYLKTHGGNVELISVGDGVVRLRLEGSCDGCPSSTMTLKSTIEEAIYKAAPDVDSLEVAGVADLPHQPERVGTPVTFIPRKKDGSVTGSRSIAH
jgi:Fe-S cluster biogenesis protein NfuA